MSKSSAIVYWLVPAKPERELFRKIIHILAKQLDAPRFEPHLTLLVARKGGGSVRTVLRRITASPIHLRVQGISFSSKFTKTLFVEFNPNAPLEKLVAHIAGAAKTSAKSLRDPHISLLYKKLPARVKRELATTIEFPFQEVTFDSIQAVRSALPITDRSDVEAWEMVATKSLR